MKEYGGILPGTRSELMKLPGIGRKSANVILSIGFNFCYCTFLFTSEMFFCQFMLRFVDIGRKFLAWKKMTIAVIEVFKDHDQDNLNISIGSDLPFNST